jgi:hypothetical protein
MDERTRQLLLAADDSKSFASPLPLDSSAYSKYYTEIVALGPELDRTVGQKLEFSAVEDASICADYGLYIPGSPPNNYTKTPILREAVILITFSNFGRFFSVSFTARDHLPFLILGELIELVESHGYVHLNDAVLDEVYTGPFRFPDKDPWNGAAPQTWRDRFFSYS